MKRKKKVIGENFGDNMFSRGDLHSESMTHSDVYRGPLADKALRAVGARAMTLDGEIIVNSSFDLSNRDDQALYAHEMYHQEHSGGIAGTKVRDAEEIAARSVEAMVYHRSSGGRADAIPDNIKDLFQEAEQSATPITNSADNNKTSTGNKEKSEMPSANQGYAALRKQGLSHSEVIDLLARMLLDKHDQGDQNQNILGGQFKGFSQ
jgi:hypothetical protein